MWSTLHKYNQGRLRCGGDAELFPSLLSAKEAFSGIVDSLVQDNIFGGKPLDPQIIVVLLGDQCIKIIVLLEKSLKTKI